jgi:septum formation protein
MSAEGVTLILASASPRRRELLARLGLTVSVVHSAVAEAPSPSETPREHVRRLALLKARTVAAQNPQQPVLAADTVVVLGARVLGKPRDREQAAAMVRDLAGNTHEVLTAVALCWEGREVVHTEAAEVTFTPYDRALYSWYVATGEGDDKAGAYAIQGRGALLVDRVLGNVQAVIGLPLAPLPRLFAAVGLRLEADGACLSLTRAPFEQRFSLRS